MKDDICDRVYAAVNKDLQAAEALEINDDVSIRQICKQFRKAAKTIAIAERPFHENVWQFCNKAFELLFAGMANHRPLHRVDFTFSIDAVMKESFPKEYLLRVGQHAYFDELEWAVDAAFEAQRFEYITWEILPTLYAERKKWKKISTMLDQGRLKALLCEPVVPHGYQDKNCWIEKYTSAWIHNVVLDWKDRAKDYSLNFPQKNDVRDIFVKVISNGGLPREMVDHYGSPSKAFIEDAVGWTFEVLNTLQKKVEEPVPAIAETPEHSRGSSLRARAGVPENLRERRTARQARLDGYGKKLVSTVQNKPVTMDAKDSNESTASGSYLTSPKIPQEPCQPSAGMPLDPQLMPRAPPMFPSRSPSTSPPRTDGQRQYGVEDAREVPVSTARVCIQTEQEHRRSSPVNGSISGHTSAGAAAVKGHDQRLPDYQIGVRDDSSAWQGGWAVDSLTAAGGNQGKQDMADKSKGVLDTSWSNWKFPMNWDDAVEKDAPQDKQENTIQDSDHQREAKRRRLEQ